MFTFPVGFGSDSEGRGYGSLALVAASNQYAVANEAPNGGSMPTSAMTMEMWVKLDGGVGNIPVDITGESRILINSYSTNATYYDVDFMLNTWNIQNFGNISAPYVGDGQWVHYAFQWSSASEEVRVYINGQFWDSGITFGITETGWSDFSIIKVGEGYSGSGNIDGKVTDFRIWDNERTHAQINANFTKRLTGSESGLAQYWKLFEDYVSSVSGGSSLSPQNSPTFSFDNPFAALYKSIHLSTDTDQYLKITDGDQTGLDITGDMTIELWFARSGAAASTSTGTLVSKGASSDLAYRLYLTAVSSDVQFNLELSSDGTSTTTYSATVRSPTDFRWTHLAVTLDLTADECKFYVDGRLIATETASIASINNSAGELRIGAYIDGTLNPGAMFIYDVRVWDVVRTLEQIRQNRATPLSSPGSETDLQGNWITSGDNTDVSQNGNHLTEQGVIVYDRFRHPATTISTYSLDLESTSTQYARITNANQTGLDITTAISVELWVKFETLADCYLVAKRASASDMSFALSYVASGSSFVFHLKPSGGSEVTFSRAITVTTGRWYHIGVTRSSTGTSAFFFFDGDFHGSVSGGFSGAIDTSTADFTVGAMHGGASPFDGKIGEVRIWNSYRYYDMEFDYARELAGDETDLVSYWRFANDYTDENANGNDLEGINSPVFTSSDNPF